MERWKITYLIILGIGLILGKIFSPIFGVVSIWIGIIATEALHQIREIKKFESRNKKN